MCPESQPANTENIEQRGLSPLAKKLIVAAVLLVTFIVGSSIYIFSRVKEHTRDTVELTSIMEASSVAFDPKMQSHLLSAEMAFFEAQKYEALNDYKRMHQAFAEASDGFTACLGAKSSLAFSVLMRQGCAECDYYKWAEAEPVFRRALEGQALDPKENALRMAKARIWLAYAMRQQDKFKPAMVILKQNLHDVEEIAKNEKEQASLRDAVKELAHLYSYQRDYGNAEKMYTRLLSMTEKQAPEESAEALDWRGYVLRCQEKYPAAISDFTRAISLDPKETKHLLARAETYKASGAYEKALADYDECIRLNPKRGNCYSERARTFVDMSNYEKAIDDYSKVIELHPASENAYRERAFAYSADGQYKLAIEDFVRAKTIRPDDSVNLLGLAAAYRQLGSYQEAINKYDQIIKKKPRSRWAYRGRGLAHEGLQEKQKAIDDYTKAIDLSGNDDSLFWSEFGRTIKPRSFCAEVLELRSKLYGELGKTDLATGDLKRVKELDRQKL